MSNSKHEKPTQPTRPKLTPAQVRALKGPSGAWRTKEALVRRGLLYSDRGILRRTELGNEVIMRIEVEELRQEGRL